MSSSFIYLFLDDSCWIVPGQISILTCKADLSNTESINTTENRSARLQHVFI